MDIIYYVFIIIVLYIIYRLFICEEFSNNVFLSKSELEKTLINNKDKYYDNFNENDLRVRNIDNINEYNDIIKKSCINISSKYSKILNDAINIANAKINKVKINGFDGKKAAKIQWSVGVFKDKDYEYGLPHTRNFIILIPEYILGNSNSLIRILIHEKIHIYQKMYPDDIKLWLKDNGFVKFRIKNKKDDTRANPDIDNYLYKNSKGEIMMSKYNELPFTINDVKYYPKNDYKYEHPFEYMAYTLEDIINK
jgi:hypothetical protein